MHKNMRCTEKKIRKDRKDWWFHPFLWCLSGRKWNNLWDSGGPRRIWARQGPIDCGGHNLPPLVEIGLNVTQNLGKATALVALPAMAPLNDKIYWFIEMFNTWWFHQFQNFTNFLLFFSIFESIGNEIGPIIGCWRKFVKFWNWRMSWTTHT